ncbi:hypothetical protein D9M68_483140 [compost metagenome]
MNSQLRSFIACAKTSVCARSQPPSTQSVADTRTPSVTDGGVTSRNAWNTSRGKRMRFSSDPP